MSTEKTVAIGIICGIMIHIGGEMIPKEFDYAKLQNSLLSTEVMALLAQVHEFKGKQDIENEKII